MKITNDKDVELIKNMYKEGRSTSFIAKEFGVSDKTIATLLRNNGVEIRKRGVISKITNHDFFNLIDTPEKAYFLGLIITDGCVVQDSRGNRSDALAIMLKETDGYILKRLEQLLGGTGDTVRNTKRGEAQYRVSSNELTSGLKRYGVEPRKTFETYLPEIDPELMPHLIRGIFDGDGSVYIKSPQSGKNKSYLRLSIYGTNKLCTQLKEHLVSVLGVSDNKVYDKDTVSFISFGKKSDIDAFYNYIYQDTDLYLTRKKAIFENFNTLISSGL